eukprot:6390357-Amphidinium_carterae.1
MGRCNRVALRTMSRCKCLTLKRKVEAASSDRPPNHLRSDLSRKGLVQPHVLGGDPRWGSLKACAVTRLAEWEVRNELKVLPWEPKPDSRCSTSICRARPRVSPREPQICSTQETYYDAATNEWDVDGMVRAELDDCQRMEVLERKPRCRQGGFVRPPHLKGSGRCLETLKAMVKGVSTPGLKLNKTDYEAGEELDRDVLSSSCLS